ncbi:hypothetical protein ACOMHN_005141 [Nucella lapillus]
MPRRRPARPTCLRRSSGSRKTSEGPLWPPCLQPGGPRRIYSSMVTLLMQTMRCPARPTCLRRSSGSKKTSEGPLWPPCLQPGGPRRIYSSMVTPLMQMM